MEMSQLKYHSARSPGGLLDLGDDENVAEHDGDVGDDLEEDELAPEDVQAAVERVVPHLGGDDGALLDAQLEELGHVVHQGDDDGGGHLAGRRADKTLSLMNIFSVFPGKAAHHHHQPLFLQ